MFHSLGSNLLEIREEAFWKSSVYRAKNPYKSFDVRTKYVTETISYMDSTAMHNRA